MRTGISCDLNRRRVVTFCFVRMETRAWKFPCSESCVKVGLVFIMERWETISTSEKTAHEICYSFIPSTQNFRELYQPRQNALLAIISSVFLSKKADRRLERPGFNPANFSCCYGKWKIMSLLFFVRFQDGVTKQ